MAGPIDPTAKGKYPVILGDGLLGKTSNEIFTGVRYNHKPALSAGDAPALARIKPSLPGKTSSYDLSFADGSGSYAYSGTRTVDGNHYVLHFDPERKAFILDKIDSVFNMNLTRTPATSDPDKLARQFPRLPPVDSASRKPDEARKGALDAASKQPRPRPRPAPASASSSKAPARSPGKLSMPPPPPRRKPDKKEQSKPVELLLPKPEPPKPEPLKDKKSARRKEEEDDEDDEDDGDGDLLIEYPGREDAAAAKRTDFSPAFPAYRAFDDFMDKRDSEGDADSPGDAEPDSKLSPPPAAAAADDDDAASINMEDDLEKEMEIAFEDLANSHHGSPQGGGGGGDESEISEED